MRKAHARTKAAPIFLATALLTTSSPAISQRMADPATPSLATTARPLPKLREVSPTPIFFGLEAQGIGDPNPFFENGRYYVFYLQNEGRHPWRMSSSSDLSTWTAPVEVVPVGQAAEPDYWTGSGSVIAESGGAYQIFYTGHRPGAYPQEIVMVSRAHALDGPWRKAIMPRLAGPPDYDGWDFRDPFVLWNKETRSYWMLLASRSIGRASVGLYTSLDLDHWSPAPPLYTETSPLNLEVPDLFHEDTDWFLLFSDQRGTSRQTRYLKASASAGPYAYGPFDALDGHGFYAGKTAGTGADRLLFGWIANRRDKRDDTELVWGGDLVAHAVRRTDSGALAVDIANPVARQFITTTRRLSLAAPAGDAIATGTRIIADLTVRPGDKFGVRFSRNGVTVAIAKIDAAAQQARFVVDGRAADAPFVAFPAKAGGRYHLDMLLDPQRGFGILYIDHFRALSFRFYGLSGTVPQFYANAGLATLDGEVRTR